MFRTFVSLLVFCWLPAGFVAVAQDAPVLGVDPAITAATETAATIEIRFLIPDRHIIYTEQVAVRLTSAPEATLTPVDIPEPKEKFDEFLGEMTTVYDHPVTLVYRAEGISGYPLGVEVDYQGCDDTTCFLPATEAFSLTPGEETTTVVAPDDDGPAPAIGDWQAAADRFQTTARGVGYMDSETFLSFLANRGVVEEGDFLTGIFERAGLVAAMLVILPLGLLLNLTPCVLPMIPVNLAIIGAGAQAGSKKRGFLLGGTYGLAMALVYGVLGLVAALTGSRMGTLNSMWWFNAAIAVVFVVMGLAMFDVFIVDLSKFQRPGGGGSRSSRGPFITAFLLGGMAALLAGACVAPVLISVLLLSANLYGQGRMLGLVLPFLLGVGMALPWPFAGAGLSFLPKPGGWMNKVKVVFGVLIFGAAIYFGKQAVVLMMNSGSGNGTVAEAPAGHHHADVLPGLEAALEQGRPVFLDFWALSCKSCMKMKKTTFVDPPVAAELENYVVIEFQADDTNDPHIDAVLKYYEVLGLPTYLVLEPKP